MNDLVDTTEMYLRTIYDLEEEGVTPLRARIAERLDQSGPTVSQTVSRMERDGLLHVAGDRHLEHVMSEDVERRLMKVLNNPTTSPFGNPIPGLIDLGIGDGFGADDGDMVRLTELPAGPPVAVVVRQLTEHVQGDIDLITRLKDAGVVPNARVAVESNQAGGVTIVIPGHENVSLPHEMAHAVKVEKV
jgi:DtxR family Mn-dependent transcriptional regulator